MGDGKLRRDIGVIGAMMLGLGSIVGTGIFVSVGFAAGAAEGWVLGAIVLAAVLAALNGLSSAQLAAAHPVSGGTYEYGYKWLRPSLGITAGWMFLCAKSASAATAALGFATYGLRLLPIDAEDWKLPIGLLALGGVVAFIMLGIRWSSWLNMLVVAFTLVTLITFIVIGTLSILGAPSNVADLAVELDSQSLPKVTGGGGHGFWEACALMFVAYTGYGRIATLGEEVREPSKTIPLAIMATLGAAAMLYLGVAWVSVTLLGATNFGAVTSIQGAPLEVVADRFVFPQVKYLVGVGAVTAMLGVLINLVLGLSRVVLAMGRRGDLPKIFGKVDNQGRAPTNAVLLVGGAIALLMLLGDMKLTWSFSAFTVLIYYAITNLAALQLSDDERRYPRILAWLGLVSCLFLALCVEPFF